MVAVLQQRGITDSKSRPGLAGGGLFLAPAEFPPRWRSRHLHMDVTCTTAPDARVVVHFPVGCSNCGQTHVLSERPSFTGGASQRFGCQKCHVQVRSSMCTCRTCGSKLVHCRCSTAGAHSTSSQRPLAAFFGGPGVGPVAGDQVPTGGPVGGARASSAPAHWTHAVTRRERRVAAFERPSLVSWLRRSSQEEAAPTQRAPPLGASSWWKGTGLVGP